MLRFLLGISFCITLSACQTETLVKDVNISKKQELHNMNMNTYFAKNTKKLDEVIQIPRVLNLSMYMLSMDLLNHFRPFLLLSKLNKE